MQLNQLKQAFERNGYIVCVFDTKKKALEYLNEQIDMCNVGFGDSLTLEQLELHHHLASHNVVFDPSRAKDDLEFHELARKAMNAEVFVTSVNALSETGELVNMDHTGNRIASALYGPRRVYFVAGVNKCVDTLEQAIFRVRNTAAVYNARRLNCNTPCVKGEARCYDCSSADRICNAMVIHFRKMADVDMEIILIQEELGL